MRAGEGKGKREKGTGNREQETGNCPGGEGFLPTSRYLFPVSCSLFPFPFFLYFSLPASQSTAIPTTSGSTCGFFSFA